MRNRAAPLLPSGAARAVVVWAPFTAQAAVSGGVTYVAGEHLADWIPAHPRQLHRRELATLRGGVGSDMLAA